jgi:hypothetical protein
MLLTWHELAIVLSALYRAADWSEPIDPAGVNDVVKEKALIAKFRKMIKRLESRL